MSWVAFGAVLLAWAVGLVTGLAVASPRYRTRPRARMPVRSRLAARRAWAEHRRSGRLVP